MIKQTTLGSPVETHGIGLHTAVPVHVRLVPAPPDTGYVFRRTDLGGFEIPATVESVAHCGYATTLMRTGVMLSTVEHLLAALRGLGIDNVFIEVDNLEIPIMDGSAEDFAEIIERAGIVEQPLARRALLVRERVSFEQGNRRISVEPADTYQIDCLIDFAHPLIGVQSLFVELSDGAFSRDIAAARTFGFTDEIETLRKANLIRGLADNEGLATQLAIYQTRYGDWRELFRSVDRIDQVTKADIRRIANQVFTDTNRTVGIIENAGSGGTPQQGEQPSSGTADQGSAQ